MSQCEGQISLMDFMAAQNESSILLQEGQMIYKPVRGDIETSIVTGESYVCCGDERGYHLKKIGGGWDVTWNRQINKTVFTTMEDAIAVAQQYLAENEHILAEDITATRVVAYKYISYGGNEITNFYAVLTNGDVYFRYGGMFNHIGKQKEIKEFEKDREKHTDDCGYAEIENYQPTFVNMYKCQKRGKWLYAAARYEFIG